MDATTRPRWQPFSHGQEETLYGYLTALLFCALFAFAVLTARQRKTKRPPSLWDPIPFVFNTVQFLTNNHKFMTRVRKILKNASLAKFHLGSTAVYLVYGRQNIQAIFSRGLAHKIGNESILVQRVFPVLYKMNKEEVGWFDNDKTGRKTLPRDSLESGGINPATRRYWLEYEHVHTEFLAREQHLQPLGRVFGRYVSQELEQQCRHEQGEWSVKELCRRTIAGCAIRTLFGPQVFELEKVTGDDFLDAFWRFDENVFQLTLGFPRWFSPAAYKAQDRFLTMIAKYVDTAWGKFDWNAPGAGETPWEQCFGARVSREICLWLRDAGFRESVCAGALGTLLFAQNSNSIPTMMWMLIEIAQDKELQQAIREEVSTARSDEETAEVFDIRKLATLPLLQSVFAEILRLHMDFNLIRHVQQDGVSMDLNFRASTEVTKKSSRVAVPRDSMLQVPMSIAHYDEGAWGVPGHPASEFWAGRHVKHVDDNFKDVVNTNMRRAYALAGRPSSFFPFGGGETICPGRHLAKHEILMVCALIVSQYELDFGGWTTPDGKVSDRPGQNDRKYSGAGALPPDRDMKIRWKKIEQASE